jgi:hypothetical protein
MQFLNSLIIGLSIAFISLIVIVLCIALFGVAFSNTPGGGAYAVAGAILVGSSLIALALSANRGRGDGD